MKNTKPPPIASWFLARISGSSVVGDYEEIYQEMASAYEHRSVFSHS